MKGITKAAKQANGRSQRCKICPYGNQRCTPEISRVCSDNFIEGFKKGVAWTQYQLKANNQLHAKPVAFVVSIEDLPEQMQRGTHNGYVAIPPEYNFGSYDYTDIKVYGGITYAEGAVLYNMNKEIVRNPILDKAEYITENTFIDDDWTIVGFDTCHAGANTKNWCRENVVKETLSLMWHLEQYKSK